MPVIRAADAPTFEQYDVRVIGYTSPSRGATEICTLRLQIEPGVESPAHWLDHEEVFLLLDGTLSFSVAGEETELTAGDALSVPARSLLQVANRGMQTAIAIVCQPAGTQNTLANGTVLGVPIWAR
jgi:quercetin dioxygenase-like cupin family protein